MVKNSPIWMYTAIVLAIVLAAVLLAGRVGLGSLAGGKEFHSELDGFSLRYPGGWKVVGREELAKYQGAFVFAAELPKRKAVFGVRVQAGETKKVNLDEVAAALDKSLPANFADFNKLSQDKLTLNGHKALQYDYLFTAGKKEKVRERLVIVAAPKRVYHLVAWSSRANFAKVSRDFDRMVDSFTTD